MTKQVHLCEGQNLLEAGAMWIFNQGLLRGRFVTHCNLLPGDNPRVQVVSFDTQEQAMDYIESLPKGEKGVGE